MDFTLQSYQKLITGLLAQTYYFQTFEEFLAAPKKKSIVLRHDVDLRPLHSLDFARIQTGYGIKGVYYFRAVPESWDETVIQEISSMGHEIGYHYECLTTCKGNIEAAIRDFEKNLTALRQLVPVSTICMHGSPMSPFDSKKMWDYYNYKDFDLVGEPYFDVDFGKVAYLTDTGRRWDGEKVSVRDKVDSPYQLGFQKTGDIIQAAQQGQLPDQIMFTFHPQRWTDNPLRWGQELITQNLKNQIKKYFYVKR